MAMTRNKAQVYSVGNYLMSGKVLGKGHFAKVEEATHRIIGKKVAIKIIDLTCIKEDYARRNLHREPRVMAKLRHPCIAALYETMMHGPRLYVVMEAAGGGDLCSHVLAARGSARGLPEARARALAAQLVSAVRHMHARGVVHRDLKMENIMLDSTKQFIKIVDFGLSNIWSSGGLLRTPCGSLEYAAPELFVDGRRYGPEVDLWSIGVIVYGMVTGGLPFAATEVGGAGGSRPQLRATIARGFTRKQRAALTCVSSECKLFIQQLLEPKVEIRMKIDEAARHRWIKRPGLRMKTHPLASPDSKTNREIYRQISELSGQSFIDVVAQIKAEPFGAVAGMYNIKTHLHQMQATSGSELLWSNTAQEPRPSTPPEYRAKYEEEPSSSSVTIKTHSTAAVLGTKLRAPQKIADLKSIKPKPLANIVDPPKCSGEKEKPEAAQKVSRPLSVFGLRKPTFKIYENGDGLDRRLASITEHSNTDVTEKRLAKNTTGARNTGTDDPLRLNSCPNKIDTKRSEFYRRAGDGLPSWRASGVSKSIGPKILLQSNRTNKGTSLGNIISPHSSSNSHCKSERAMPVGWYSNRNNLKDAACPRLRRTAPIK
ncbi:serine/threonine-protein kinase par-1-like [Leptidea sinapis]|uniref:serine/threonine-protein kinase par-1-like n=1 Tax=Leptidea sinapis TaxID=189913 RepID=UPI002138939B|nr:serine/threonine-protein kinase par-1-like [Leptidea sinapis]